VYAASGSALERLREKFLANFQNEISTEPEIPRPEWPAAIRQRVAEQRVNNARAFK
jgi:hypothetical protein